MAMYLMVKLHRPCAAGHDANPALRMTFIGYGYDIHHYLKLREPANFTPTCRKERRDLSSNEMKVIPGYGTTYRADFKANTRRESERQISRSRKIGNVRSSRRHFRDYFRHCFTFNPVSDEHSFGD
jgi:hypothetical protein